MKDEDLKAWSRIEADDIGNALHGHFEAFARWDWREVADEGARVWSLMFGEEIERWSAKDAVIYAVAAQAHSGAVAAMAAALGLEEGAVELALEDWYQNQESLPAAVGAEDFFRMAAERKAEQDMFLKELMAADKALITDKKPQA